MVALEIEQSSGSAFGTWTVHKISSLPCFNYYNKYVLFLLSNHADCTGRCQVVIYFVSVVRTGIMMFHFMAGN